MVLVAEPSQSRGLWPLGRIVSTQPGQDGQVRAVTVRTQCREYKRPITKLCLLEEAGARTLNRLNVVFRLGSGMCRPFPEFPVPVTVIDAFIDSCYEHVRV